jgi:hypothetical protein
MDDRDDWEGATQTTASGLIRLTSTIASLVREGAMDTRFGAKLLKRVEKEARRVTRQNEAAPVQTVSQAEQEALAGVIGECEQALRQRDAAFLVEANARLREHEEASGKGRKKKDAGKDVDKDGGA